jgi:hypothetical protein
MQYIRVLHIYRLHLNVTPVGLTHYSEVVAYQLPMSLTADGSHLLYLQLRQETASRYELQMVNHGPPGL